MILFTSLVTSPSQVCDAILRWHRITVNIAPALAELNVKIYLGVFGYADRPLMRSLLQTVRPSWIAITSVA
jgi:hypothetical protein